MGTNQESKNTQPEKQEKLKANDTKVMTKLKPTNPGDKKKAVKTKPKRKPQVRSKKRGPQSKKHQKKDPKLLPKETIEQFNKIEANIEAWIGSKDADLKHLAKRYFENGFTYRRAQIRLHYKTNGNIKTCTLLKRLYWLFDVVGFQGGPDVQGNWVDADGEVRICPIVVWDKEAGPIKIVKNF